MVKHRRRRKSARGKKPMLKRTCKRLGGIWHKGRMKSNGARGKGYCNLKGRRK